MQIHGLKPEVEQRLLELQGAVQSPKTKTLDELIADYMANGDHDEWTVQTARRIFEENAEFFQMLGDR